MKCEICHKSPPKDNVSLFRINEFGVKGIWRCKTHLTFEQESNIDFDVKKIVEIIEQDNRNKN